jgi:hypothetical protein
MHRVADAEDRLDFARLLLTKARERLESALNMIDQPDKRDSAFKALDESDRAWEDHVGAYVTFQVEAGPAPSGSTSALSSAVSAQVVLTEERARQIAKWATWLLTNYDERR